MKHWKSSTGDEAKLFASTGELFSAKPPPMLWAIPGLLPAVGLAVLAGRALIGKSCLAISMALAVASGQGVLGYGPVQTGRVLYVQADSEEWEWQKQVRETTAAFMHGELADLPFATLYMPKNWLSSGVSQAWVKEAVQTVNPNLVVWDSLNTTAGTGMDLNSHAGMSTTLNQLQKVAGPGRAQLLLCHTNKDPNKTGIDKIAYHHSLVARARAHLLLSVEEEDMTKDPKPGKLYVGLHTTKPDKLHIVQTGPLWVPATEKPKLPAPTGKGLQADDAW